jgi:hypothetical protein
MTSRRQAIWLLLVAFAAALAGCTKSDELNSPTAMRLKGLATMYLDYAAQKSGGGPPNEVELKKFMRLVETFVLEDRGIDPKNIDATFVSLRDQQPFVVIYGVGLSRISGTSAPVVAYEKTGKNGMRLVAFANTKLDYVDDDGLKALLEKKEDK